MPELNPKKLPNSKKPLRKKIIKVSVSDDEFESLQKMAGKKPIAKYLREAGLMNAPIKETAQAKKASHGYDENIYYEFVRQGVNLNLLSREILTHAKKGTLTKEEFNQLAKSLNEIRRIGYSILQAHEIKFIDLED